MNPRLAWIGEMARRANGGCGRQARRLTSGKLPGAAALILLMALGLGLARGQGTGETESALPRSAQPADGEVFVGEAGDADLSPVPSSPTGLAATRRSRPPVGQEPYPGAWAPAKDLEVALHPQRPDEAQLRDAKQASEGKTSIGEFLAVGQQSLGVVFYSFEAGRTKGIFAADVVTRIDDLRLEINHLEAQLAGSQADAPMSWIEVDKGTWYLPLNLLYSEEPSELRRPNLRVVGQGCTYRQDSEVIEVHGNTHTWIHPNQNLSNSAPGTDALAPRPQP